MNARSEFVCPLNSAGGGVCEITRRFQTASPGLSVPAFNPTRGSGYGSPGDMSLTGGIALVRAEPVLVVAHAAEDRTAASEKKIFDLVLKPGFMTDSSSASNPPIKGGGWVVVGATACRCRASRRSAASPFVRSQWSDRR